MFATESCLVFERRRESVDSAIVINISNIYSVQEVVCVRNGRCTFNIYMFHNPRGSGTPYSTRREKMQFVSNDGSPVPHPPAVPRLSLQENVMENQMPVKTPRGMPISTRGLNPRFQRQLQAVPQSAVGANPIIPNAPITAAEARARYGVLLNTYEMREIDDYQEIFYLGQITKKTRPSLSAASNYGYDDAQHHYRASVGDHVIYRYEIRAVLGKGAFGQVLRCYDHKTKSSVALKIIVNTELMHEQGRIECSVVQHITKLDPTNQHHLIRGIDFFIFRKHICTTSEILGQNLYEYSRAMKFRPIPPRQMKPAARQMLEALAFIHANSIVHCDLKPENVLIDTSGFPNVRLIDFGSSCFVGHQRYEYIQSRFYRAPEVILGIKYGPPMDVWSFACIVVEIITGKPIFPGDNEHEQLEMLMQVLGPVPDTLRTKCSRRKEFFTSDGKVVAYKGQKNRRTGSLTLEAATHIGDPLLLDLLKKCLEWKQEDRISAADALAHPWFHVKEVPAKRPQTSQIFPELIR
jgi:dual specificity tyrosine-phosphorylation-regulated kinase 2/3/4